MEVREFLELLCVGIREIPKKHHPLFYALQKLDVITKKEKFFKLKEGFAIGFLDVVRKDLIFLKSFSPSHSKDFRVMGGLRGLVSGDIALVKIASKSTRARLVSLLYSPIQKTLVYLEKIKGKICAIDLKSTQDKPIIHSLKAKQKALSSLPPHTVLEIECRSGEILEVLGVLEDESVDEKIVLSRYGRDEEFSQECLNLAESFGHEVYAELYPKRKNLTHLPFCTIDPKDAKDHDDAICFDATSCTLYVAIADVSEYVSKDSSIDREAKKRGFSLYLPHKSIPMLPRNLSENICSLKEGKDRLALVWEMKLDENSKVVDSCVYEALICSHWSLNYEEVEEWLKGENLHTLPQELGQSILGFFPLAQRSRSNRLKKGYDFLGEEVRLVLNNAMSLERVESKSEGESNRLIEEAMLLANVESAKMLDSMPTCGIYRVHEEIKEEQFFNLLESVRVLGFAEKIKYSDIHQGIQIIQKWAKEQGMQKEIDRLIIKAQNQAQYSSENLGHFGLGFEFYTHFTSPIRRYSDLCVHRVIKEYLNQGKRLEYLSQDFAPLSKSLSDLEREVGRAELEYKDRKFAHWARAHMGEELKVSVIDECYPPLCVALEKINGAKIVLQERGRVERFWEMEAKIVEVDLANARIYAQKV